MEDYKTNIALELHDRKQGLGWGNPNETSEDQTVASEPLQMSLWEEMSI